MAVLTPKDEEELNHRGLFSYFGDIKNLTIFFNKLEKLMKFALERHNFPKKSQFFSSKIHIAWSNCANPLQS
jgi:hypothetical protein